MIKRLRKKIDPIRMADFLFFQQILYHTHRRHKRLSDQRRAELETLMALSKMTGKLVNVIRGGRQLQPTKT